MLKISKAAFVAAALGLSSVPAIGVGAAWAEDAAPAPAAAAFTSSISIPTITATDSTMDEAALRDALSGGFAKHADEIARLDAASISIPEVALTMTVSGDSGPTTTTIVYRDIALDHVEDGVAASASIGSVQSSNPEGSLSLGRMSTGMLDFGAILALYSVAPATGSAGAMTTLYKDLSFEGGSLTTPEANCTLGKITASEFDARPLAVSFGTMMETAQRMDAMGDNPAPEDVATVVTFLTDMFEAFKSTPLDLHGLSCTGTGEDGKSFSLGIGGLTVDGYRPGVYPAVRIHDLEIKSGDDGITLDAAEIKSTDLSGPIAAVRAAGTSLDATWLQNNYRQLIPAFGGLSFTDFAMDIADPENEGQRLKARIGLFDLTLGNYVNGIPTSLSTRASGVEFDLPADSTDETAQMLAAVGISHVSMGYELTAGWDRANQQIDIGKVALDGQNLGSFAVGGLIGNAADQLFDANPQTQVAASMGLTLKSVTVHLTDAGLGNALVPVLAAQQGVDPASFRTQMAGIVEGSALQLLGSTDAARALGAALGDFVSGKASDLTIAVSAKSASGLTVPQLMQAGNDPTQLVDLVDITGTAK